MHQKFEIYRRNRKESQWRAAKHMHCHIHSKSRGFSNSLSKVVKQLKAFRRAAGGANQIFLDFHEMPPSGGILLLLSCTDMGFLKTPRAIS